MTPNDIILALVDVASAAFAVQHGAPDSDDMARLRAKLFVLDQLPQPANMPPLTPSAKARYFMQSFLGGAPVEIDGKQFSAALILSGLGESLEYRPPAIQAVAHTPANDGWVLAKETVVEMPDGTKELGYTTIQGFPVFTDEQDAHREHAKLNLPLGWVVMRVVQLIPGYVLPEVTRADMAAQRDKLLADTVDGAHRIHADADLLSDLRMICGYVENGSSEYVTIGQDDATREWTVTIGDSWARNSGRARRYTAHSFHQAIRLAVDGEVENETCKFCGFAVEFPCEEPPVDICSAAIRAEERQKRSTAPAAPAQQRSERDIMKARLLELKDVAGASVAKRIIHQVGGVGKMMEVPDLLIPAVTYAAIDRIALEHRLETLRRTGNHSAIAALLRGYEEPGKISAEAKPHLDAAVRRAELSVAMQQEAREPMPALPITWPTPPAPIPQQDDQVQGQGGEFDGGGASGDFQ
jgi:hypothetical protein